MLIRHGESNATVTRRIGGPRTCSGLSALGKQQADRLAARLAETGELQADVLYSSGYPRAHQTAEAIAQPVGVDDVLVETGFGEHDPGPDIDGMTFEAFVEQHGQPDWLGDPHAVTFPGGETMADFHHRVGRALFSVVERHRGKAVVVVCHAGVINYVFRRCLGVSDVGGFSLWTKNTSLTELVLMPPATWRIDRYNDSAHLAGLPASTPPETD